MRNLRFSILNLSIVLAVFALDLAVIRSLTRSQPGSTNTHLYLVPIDATHSMMFASFALGVLPMTSLLVPATIRQGIRIRRTGTASAPWIGFTTFGWLAVFAFMSLAALSPPAIQSYLLGISEALSPVEQAIIGANPASWLLDAIEWLLCIVAFLLPELAVALAGGWLIGRSGRCVIEPPIHGGGIPAQPLRPWWQ